MLILTDMMGLLAWLSVNPLCEDIAALIYTMNLQNFFCQINGNCRNLHFGCPFIV
ncbi:hypothetical protein NTG1052_520042 [Candidatus Nitrotoga sp. 1052]|nr:hypothetical protein NTG1052_520042 [Candidatus Nitrotoga sp. 1052]